MRKKQVEVEMKGARTVHEVSHSISYIHKLTKTGRFE